MKYQCPLCKTGNVVTKRVTEPVERVLPDIVADGVERGVCDNCRDGTIGFPRPRELTRVWLAELVAKPWRLAPNEVRALRGMVGPRAEDLARKLGVSVGQISRWETGAKPISALADRLLRALAAAQYELPLPVDLFGNLDDSRVGPLALRLKLGRTWKVVERGVGAVSTKRRSKAA